MATRTTAALAVLAMLTFASGCDQRTEQRQFHDSISTKPKDATAPTGVGGGPAAPSTSGSALSGELQNKPGEAPPTLPTEDRNKEKDEAQGAKKHGGAL